LKLPSQCEDPLDEAGGVLLGPVHVAGKAGVEPIECTPIEAHEPGGVSLDMNTAPASTEGTTSIELAGRAEEATTAEPEALEPRAESTAWCRLETLPLPPPPEGLGEPGLLLQEAPTVGMHRHDQLPQESPSKGEHGPQWAPRETP